MLWSPLLFHVVIAMLPAFRAFSRHPLGAFLVCLVSVALPLIVLYGLWLWVPWQAVGHGLSAMGGAIASFLAPFGSKAGEWADIGFYGLFWPFRVLARLAILWGWIYWAGFGVLFLSLICWLVKVSRNKVNVKNSDNAFGWGMFACVLLFLSALFVVPYTCMYKVSVLEISKVNRDGQKVPIEMQDRQLLRLQHNALVASRSENQSMENLVDAANAWLVNEKSPAIFVVEKDDHGNPVIRGKPPLSLGKLECLQMGRPVYGFSAFEINGVKVDKAHPLASLCKYDLENDIRLEVTPVFWKRGKLRFEDPVFDGSAP